MAQSGIFTQDTLAVLHSVDQASGRLTQQVIEVLATTADGFVTQQNLAVLHSVDQASGRLTQNVIEVLYTTGVAPEEPVGTGTLTQHLVEYIHDFKAPVSGLVTQQVIEYLAKPQPIIAVFSTSIEINQNQKQKIIDVDCESCGPDCCGPCCCGCSYVPSENNFIFEIKWTCTHPDSGPPPVELDYELSPVVPATALNDCYNRIPGILGEFTSSYVWSGDLCSTTNCKDFWRMTFGCHLFDFEHDEDVGCDQFELYIEVLQCSGQASPPEPVNDFCDGDVQFCGAGACDTWVPADRIREIEGVPIPGDGAVSGCSCGPFFVAYTGICLCTYRCCCCDTNLGQFCMSVEVFPQGAP